MNLNKKIAYFYYASMGMDEFLISVIGLDFYERGTYVYIYNKREIEIADITIDLRSLGNLLQRENENV